MARVITKELAERIVKKLGAKLVDTAGPHDMYGVFHGDDLVSTFGVRRGSSKDAGHDHIPKELHVGPRFAKGLGQCPISREEWIQEPIKQGLISQ